MNYRPAPDLKTDLLDNHWRHCYNWDDVSDSVIEYLTDRWQCSAAYVRSVMLSVEKEHPKPKHKNAATCPKCHQVVIYIGKHACEPAVVNFVGIDEVVHQGRIPHVCQQWNGQSGFDAAVGNAS